MAGYKKIDETDLAWRENREKVTLQGRQLLRRVLNEALDELDAQFQAALKRGEILELDPTKEELKSLLLDHAQKELGAGGASA